MRKYDVTIGIPVYQVAAYVEKSLLTALSQTYASIEFLIVDDCSADASLHIVERIQQNHNRGTAIHILRNKQHRGVALTRNRIIDEAQGDYLYFMDADDQIAPETIALLMAKMRQNEADIVFGSYRKTMLTGAVEIYQYPDAQLFGDDELAMYAYRKFGGIQASACNYLVSVALLRTHQHRFIDTDYWEDLVFTFDLVTHVRRAVLVSTITYDYICRENSLSNYQCRNHVSKTEIERNMRAIDYLKDSSQRVAGKPYFPLRCDCLMKASLHVVFHVLKHRGETVPPMTDAEIRVMLRHPATWKQIVNFRQHRLANICYFALAILPPSWCVTIVRSMGKLKKKDIKLCYLQKKCYIRTQIP